MSFFGPMSDAEVDASVRDWYAAQWDDHCVGAEREARRWTPKGNTRDRRSRWWRQARRNWHAAGAQ